MNRTEGPVEQTMANVRDDEDPGAPGRLRTMVLLLPSLGGIVDILTVIRLVDERKIRDLSIVAGLLLVGVPVWYCYHYIYNRGKCRGFALIVSLFLMATVGGLAGFYGLWTGNQFPQGLQPANPPGVQSASPPGVQPTNPPTVQPSSPQGVVQQTSTQGRFSKPASSHRSLSRRPHPRDRG